MTYKHKTHAVDGDGKIISNADLDFYIDDVCQFVFCSYFISFFCFGPWETCMGQKEFDCKIEFIIWLNLKTILSSC